MLCIFHTKISNLFSGIKNHCLVATDKRIMPKLLEVLLWLHCLRTMHASELASQQREGRICVILCFLNHLFSVESNEMAIACYGNRPLKENHKRRSLSST